MSLKEKKIDFQAIIVAQSSCKESLYSNPVSVTCERVNVGQSATKLRLLSSARYWGEIDFDATIRDGLGRDMYCTGWNGPITRFFQTNRKNKIRELPISTCNGNCLSFHVISFGLSDIPLSIKPKTIHTSGVVNRDSKLGSLRARI